MTQQGMPHRSAHHADALLRPLAVFDGVDDALIAAFAQAARYRILAKGQMLYLQDDPAESFYVLLRGWVKCFRETFDGKEAITDIVPAGQMLGDDAASRGHYSTSAQAVEETELLVLPLALLSDAMRTDHQLVLNLLEQHLLHQNRQRREIEHLSLQNASQRIGCFLLRLCHDRQDSRVTLHLPYDKTLIAARLGMQPETFSRALATLKKQTGIAMDGPVATITDVDALARYSCSECTASFPCED